MRTKCKKIEFRIECKEHGYPYSEACFPDRTDHPLPCDRQDAVYEGWIDGLTAPGYPKGVIDLTRLNRR